MCGGFSYLFDQPLKNYSTIKIGGSAARLSVIHNESQLAHALQGTPVSDIVVIGRGSNVLFSDKGVLGTVLVLRNCDITLSGCEVEVGAGALLPSLSKKCMLWGLGGVEWMCGIPSSMGGAVFMNAGAHGHSICDVLVSCKVLRDGKIIELLARDCGFGYRHSAFKDSLDIIVSAKLRLTYSDSTVIAAQMAKCAAARRRTQPSGLSLGSVFKNADLPAGYYIDKAGLKGEAVGDLFVSHKHANFIINRGSGTAKDFLVLTDIIKERVFKMFGITLKEEFVKLGEF